MILFKKKIILCALLFFIISLVFIHKINDWRFFDDDYGAIFTAISTKNPTTFFFDNHNEKTILPSNQIQNYQNFFDVVTFRPLTLFWYWFVAKILPTNQPQSFFLLSIFLHAWLTVLIFLAACGFLELKHSFFLALIFGLFPFNGKFIGRFVIQPYSLGFILNIFAHFFQKTCFKTNKIIFFIFSLILLFCSFLIHEVFLSFFLIHFFYFLSQQKLNLNKQFLFTNMTHLLIYFGIICFYFLLKKIIYPDVLNKNMFLQTFLLKLPNRFYDFVTMLVDVHGYSFIPSGNKCLKVLLLGLDFALFSLLFFTSRRNYLFWLGPLIFFWFQLWPSVLIMHVSRYLYFAIPFFLLAAFLAYEKLEESLKKTCVGFCLKLKITVTLISGILIIPKDLLFLENKFKFVDDNLKKISKNLKFKNNAKIIGIGLPFDYFPVSGFAQAIWLHSENKNLQIFYDQFHTVRFNSLNHLPINKFCHLKLNTKKQNLFLSCDSKTGAHILLHNPFGLTQPYNLGTMEILEKINEKAFEISLTIKKNFWPDYLICFERQVLKLKKPNTF